MICMTAACARWGEYHRHHVVGWVSLASGWCDDEGLFLPTHLVCKPFLHGPCESPDCDDCQADCQQSDLTQHRCHGCASASLRMLLPSSSFWGWFQGAIWIWIFGCTDWVSSVSCSFALLSLSSLLSISVAPQHDKVVFYAAVYRAFDTAKSRTQDSWEKDGEILALQQGKAETGLEKTVTSLTKLDETL